MGTLKVDGNLLLTGDIRMQTSNMLSSIIQVKADSNAYGQNLLIGAGGNTVIGGGESAQTFFAASGIKDEKNLYLTADGSVHVYTNCDSIANRKLVMSLNADGTISLPNSKKIDTDGTFSGSAAGIYRMNHFTTEEQVDNFQTPNTLQYCTIGAEYTPIGNDGILISAGWSSGRYGAQIWIDDGGGSGGMKIRSFGANNGANWNAWQTILTSKNYNSYTPSLTGAGASGDWNISVKNLYYTQELSTAALLDSFNEASKFKAGYWTNSLVPGCGNGIILNMGWTSATYGAQLAIDDDPTYFIALRQKNGSGWADWKRIPMGDGTGASGTWGISITGNASYASSAGHATYLNTVAGDEIRIHNATGLTNGGRLWLGWAWADGNKTVTKDWCIGNFSGGGLANIYAANFIGAWQGNSPSAFAPASHSHSYVPISGGTMTGKLQVNNIIFGYNYTNSNNAAAFMFDKPGSHYTGIGANGSDSAIKFGPCNADGTWVNGFAQHWTFQGTIRPGCIILTNDQWTGYGTADPNDLGLDKVVGRLYFRI